jgi:hypothetical protein
VVNPAHYGLGLEPIEVIEAWSLDFRLANVIKYVARFQSTHNMQDIEKAENYLHRFRTGTWLDL